MHVVSPNHRTRFKAVMDAGFTIEQAQYWAAAASHLSVSALVTAATAWRACGIPAGDAVRWHQAGWDPEESTRWWLHGFTPAQATFVTRRLQAAAPAPTDVRDQHDLYNEWLTSGLSTDDIVLCVATGHLTLDSAMQLVNAMAQDPSLRGTLRVQADMAGVNLDSIRGGTR